MTDMGVFSNDYSHFEKNHAAFPIEAQSVFARVSELRQALTEFRDTTENQCVVDDNNLVADVLGAMDAVDNVEDVIGAVDNVLVADVIDDAKETNVVEEALVADALTAGPTEEPVSAADAIATGPSTVADGSVEVQFNGPEQMDEARLSPVHADYFVEESV